MGGYDDTAYMYIVLVQAMTGIGKLARRLTNYAYTHIAVSLDASLTDFITFSRRNHYTALDAGMMHECRSCYAYGDLEAFGAKVFQLPVSAEQRARIEKTIRELETDGAYLFNLFSMITMPVFHGFLIYKTHNCMSFTGLMIKETGAVAMQKKYYRYSIPELDALLTDYLYFEGELKKDEKIIAGYMVKPKWFHRAKVSVKTVFQLFGRLVTKGIIP